MKCIRIRIRIHTLSDESFLLLITLTYAVCLTGPSYNECVAQEQRRIDEEHARTIDRMRQEQEASSRRIQEENQRRAEAQRKQDDARRAEYDRIARDRLR